MTADAERELVGVLHGGRDTDAMLWPLSTLLDHQSTPSQLRATTARTWAGEVLLHLRPFPGQR